jgi:glycosyltransferase 2 family protein
MMAWVCYAIWQLREEIDINHFLEVTSHFPIYWYLYLLPSFIAHLLATKAWLYCDEEKQFKKFDFRHLFFIRLTAEVLSQFNPTGVLLGDFYKFKSFSKFNLNPEALKQNILLFRIHSFISYILLFCITMSLWLFAKAYYYICAGILIILILLVLAIIYPKKIENIQTSAYSNYLNILIANIKTALSKVRLSSNQLKANIFLIMHWVVGGSEIMVILYLLNSPTNLVNSLLVDQGVQVIKALAIMVPGQVGIEEISNKILLDLVEQKIGMMWIIFSLLRRIRQLFWVAISAGYLVMNEIWKMWYKKRNIKFT